MCALLTPLTHTFLTVGVFVEHKDVYFPSWNITCSTLIITAYHNAQFPPDQIRHHTGGMLIFIPTESQVVFTVTLIVSLASPLPASVIYYSINLLPGQ